MRDGPGLGIFTKHMSTDVAKGAAPDSATTATSTSAAVGGAPSARLDRDIFNEMERRELLLATRLPPVNAFHRQLQWTRAQRLWRYPIDNESGSYCRL